MLDIENRSSLSYTFLCKFLEDSMLEKNWHSSSLFSNKVGRAEITKGYKEFHTKPLEKEMASHSRTLAWEISWTEEPGRLQSTGLQRVGHDLATKQ